MGETQNLLELEVCLQNPGAQVAERVAAHFSGQVGVRRYDCLEQCTLCARAAFAWLRGECWQAASDAALYTQLRHATSTALAAAGPAPSPDNGNPGAASGSPRQTLPGAAQAFPCGG
ncbi:MAG: YuzB family protein [Alicyclobacillus sp.]|nr:YuzB family protein [Alicyclobacillus sp.]